MTLRTHLLGGAAAAALLTLSVACSSERATDRPQASEVSTPASEKAVACSSDGECLEVDARHKAAVYRAEARGEQNPVVIWSPGGPGLMPPPAESRDRWLPRALAEYDVVVPVEPWALEPDLAARCASDTGASEDCSTEQWAWDEAQLVELVGVIEAELGRGPSGVYATSFGAPLLEPMFEPVLEQGGWVLLHNPAPVPGVSLGTIADARLTAAVDRISTPATRAELERWVASGVGKLERDDVALALMAIVTDVEANDAVIRAIRKALTDDGPSPELQRTLRRGAKRFALGGSATESRASRWGYEVGMCSRYDGSAGAAHLDALVADCPRSVPRSADGLRAEGRMLFLQGADDVVVPPVLQRGWLKRYADAEVRVLEDEAHDRSTGKVDSEATKWLASLPNG